MATAFSLQGTFDYPPDDGQPVAQRAFSQSGNFTSKVEVTLELTGAGTQVVDFGTITGVLAFLIEVDPTAQAPVNLLINGGAPIEVAAAGFMAYSNPVPGSPITSLSVVHTQDARVQVRLLG